MLTQAMQPAKAAQWLKRPDGSSRYSTYTDMPAYGLTINTHASSTQSAASAARRLARVLQMVIVAGSDEVRCL